MSGITVPSEARVKYLTRRLDEIGKIKISLNSNPDWELIDKVAHQIKGNAITFDFPELSDCAKKLEDAAKNKDLKKTREYVEGLEEQVTAFLRGLA